MTSDTRLDRYATAYAIIPHTHRPALLMVEGPGGWELPHVQAPVIGDSLWREASLMNEAFRQRFSIRINVLRCLNANEAGEALSGLFLMENRHLAWDVHAGQEWLGREEIDGVRLAAPEHRAFINAWFEGALPKVTLPWTHEGWLESAELWMGTRLEEHGLSVVGRVEQARSWFLSCILRAQTTGGEVYLKAAPPMFAHEPRLTLKLAQRYPHLLPEVLAIDDERGWLLMRAVEGVRLDRHPSRELYLPRWEGLLRDFARIQLDYVERADELLAMGLPDWRLENVAANIELFFMRLPRLFEGSESGPSAEEMARYQAVAPRLMELCARLSDYALPLTLHHGDFHSGNILANDEGCKLLDWAGGVWVAHPFFFLTTPFEEHTKPDIRERMLRAYLQPWQRYGTWERLSEAVQLALPLGWVGGAFGHALQIQNADTPWEKEQERGNLAYCLREILNY